MSTDAPAGPIAYRLRLFIAGTAPRSQRTVETVRRICETHLADRYEMEVVDIYQQPVLAERDGVLAAPTLLKVEPRPERRIAGDLADERRVLRGLDLLPSPSVSLSSSPEERA